MHEICVLFRSNLNEIWGFFFKNHDMCVIAGCPNPWMNRHPIWYHGKNLKIHLNCF